MNERVLCKDFIQKMRFTVVVLFAFVAFCGASSMTSTLLKHAVKSQSTPNPGGCCMPSEVYQGIVFEVTASWDVHGNAGGYNFFTLQIDSKNKLLYSHQTKVNPAPKEEQLEIWYTPGAVEKTWFMFFRAASATPNTTVCYVQTLTVQPDILNQACYKEPVHSYGGNLLIGTHMVEVWDKKAGRYNTTTLVDPTACIPQTDLGFGWDASGDFIERETTFANVQFTITDPAHFIPPTGCKPVPATQKQSVRKALGVFPSSFGFVESFDA